MNHTNEIDGKSIDREEVDEIVIAQVNALKFIWKYLTFFFCIHFLISSVNIVLSRWLRHNGYNFD